MGINQVEASTLPPNNLHLDFAKQTRSNIDENQFHAIIDQFTEIYQGYAQTMGIEFRAERHWANNTVNAYASKPGDNINFG